MTGTPFACLLSGGMDSTTALAATLDGVDPSDGLAMFVDYGQRHLVERSSAERVAAHYGVTLITLDLIGFGRSVSSALTDNTRPIPEGDYDPDNMTDTMVPNRNAVMLSAAAGIAASRGIPRLITAIHGGDHHLYPDCRPEFLDAIDRSTRLSCGVGIEAPYIGQDKTAIALEGHRLGVPYAITWSCYNGRARHCGRCSTCRERAGAFAAAGLTDPTTYETDGAPA